MTNRCGPDEHLTFVSGIADALDETLPPAYASPTPATRRILKPYPPDGPGYFPSPYQVFTLFVSGQST
jgi:hypothetical protein